MNHELQPLINELCYLAISRNEINTRRHRARFRKNYYAHAVRVVEAHNGSSSDLRYAEKHNANGARQAKVDSIKSDMAWLIKKHPKPKKWQEMGLHKLRSLVLQGEGEYAMAKHETMEFSIKHRARVKYLTSTLNCNLAYDNGSINVIGFGSSRDALFLEEIHHFAAQYQLDKAVEKMIKE